MMQSKHIHGDREVFLHEDIITARFIGLFNEHGARRITNEIRECVAQMQGKPFAILIDDLQLSGGTPEAYVVLEEYNQWLNTQKLVAKAMVLTSKAHKAIIDKLSPSRLEQNIQYFIDEDSALDWLRSELNRD
ncbi:MAG: STAS/SEC14 domain-containing protein [Oceanospirillaceae bacterium]|nr:STAS/SEC14 domain-containing protein [Oceanospirillaceae bacterium]